MRNNQRGLRTERPAECGGALLQAAERQQWAASCYRKGAGWSRARLLLVLCVVIALLPACSFQGGERGQMEAQIQVQYPDPPPDYAMLDVPAIDTETEWKISNVHDPSIFKDGEMYYLYSTDVKVGGSPGAGIMVRKSADLIRWEWVGYALEGVPREAADWTGATNLWAPDIAKLGDTYYLYYSASTFGTNRSYIGVATSASPEGPWTDQGAVIKTAPGDGPNAIDPNIVRDAQGGYWFVYGSFFGGIHIAPLDEGTGKLKEEGVGIHIAARDRATEEGAVEGPYIIYNEDTGYYYLFVSYDSLYQDYNVRVGRSEQITGPYLDAAGRDMKDVAYRPQYEVGNKLIGGYRFSAGDGWLAPGHNSVLQDENGADYLIHHARPEADKNWMYLHVRKLVWTADGWPTVSPERYAGEREQDIPEQELYGDWELVAHAKYMDGIVPSYKVTLHEDGRAASEYGELSWSYDGKRTLSLSMQEEAADRSVDEPPVEVQVLAAWDWELKRPTLVFTGLDSEGSALWGKKLP